MSQALSIAHAGRWNLATILMVCITVFHAGNDEYGVCRPPNMMATTPP